MNFRYFRAPLDEMAGLSAASERCDLCGTNDRCFDLSRALTPTSLLPAVRGCASCLQRRRFGFFHVTDAGYLDEGGLTWYGEAPVSPSRVFMAGRAGLVEITVTPETEAPSPPSEQAIAELRATPTFSTWNEVSWPLHCGDFMSFEGSWQPTQVIARAQELDLAPEVLFESMVEPRDLKLWDGSAEWSVNFVVFRCTSCTQHRGIIDVD